MSSLSLSLSLLLYSFQLCRQSVVVYFQWKYLCKKDIKTILPRVVGQFWIAYMRAVGVGILVGLNIIEECHNCHICLEWGSHLKSGPIWYLHNFKVIHWISSTSTSSPPSGYMMYITMTAQFGKFNATHATQRNNMLCQWFGQWDTLLSRRTLMQPLQSPNSKYLRFASLWWLVHMKCDRLSNVLQIKNVCGHCCTPTFEHVRRIQ